MRMKVAKYISEKLIVLGYYAMVSEYMESMKDKYFCKGILILISKSRFIKVLRFAIVRDAWLNIKVAFKPSLFQSVLAYT